jgi:predicted phosphodiesterase
VRLHVLGDLHLEVNPCELPDVEADVVVLAGDIHRGARGVEWARARWSRPVIYVAGNHEIDNGWQHDFATVSETLEQLRGAAQGTNVAFLENDQVVIDGVRFLGCTLWTDFALYGPGQQLAAMQRAERSMPEYAHAFVTRDRHLHAQDVLEMHEASVRWLTERLDEPFAGPTVVVTHHAPSVRSSPPWYHGDPLSPAFVSDLAYLCGGERVRLWIHGHTHHPARYEIDGTLVVSNQRGYAPRPPISEFRPDLVVEV